MKALPELWQEHGQRTLDARCEKARRAACVERSAAIPLSFVARASWPALFGKTSAGEKSNTLRLSIGDGERESGEARLSAVLV
jgi:hypothetical protein